jgi:hypothetical protein
MELEDNADFEMDNQSIVDGCCPLPHSPLFTCAMQDNLLEQLSRSTEMLISSLSGGPLALQAFTQYWTQLEAAFVDFAPQDNDEEAISTIRNNLSTIEIIAQRFLDLDEEVHSVGETFQKEIDVILADLKIDDVQHSPRDGLS